MKFTFTKKAAKKMARALEKYFQAHGVELSHGQALDALAVMQGEKDANALLASITREAVDAELGPIEHEHIASCANDHYGDDGECELRAHTGFALRYSATSDDCEYVRVVDPLGREIAYWDSKEWKEDPKLVMGAILGALVRGRPLTPGKDSKSVGSSQPTDRSGLPDGVSLPQSLTIYTECYCTNEYGEGPSWARMTLDAGQLSEILRLSRSVKDQKLVRLSLWGDPDAWSGEEDEFRLDSGMLEIEDDRYWYRASMRHADYCVETSAIELRALLTAITGPAVAAYDACERRGQVIIYASDHSREDFIETLLEHGEVIPERTLNG